jgi:prepilin-type N-terminal cleavage/methylation domain-containing protein
MRSARKPIEYREAFTLIELLVVIAIILVIAALAAAFAPNVSDSQNLTRSVDQLEQWLLTAKMRAKRDQLATGLRLVQAQNDPANTFSQCQYIQQPDAMAGGWVTSTATAGSIPYNGSFLNGGIALPTATPNQVQLYNVDCSMGQTLAPNQYLIQAGDYLEVRGGGVYLIAGAAASTANPPVTTIGLSGTAYDQLLNIAAPTTNYRILRQPRLLMGEAPLELPNGFAVDLNLANSLATGPSGSFDILFSPTGAVVGANAGSGKVLVIVHDLFGNPTTSFDPNRAGIVAVQCRTGFIGAYNVAPGADPFAFVELGRESGL